MNLFLITLAVFWGAALVGILWMLRRWLKDKSSTPPPPWTGARARLRAFYLQVTVFTLLLAQQFYEVLVKHRPFRVLDAFGFLLIGGYVAFVIWQLPKLRALAAQEPKPPRKSLPPFFWQGLLILLPVLLLSVLGGVFIYRDRTFAEEAARQQARGLMGEISPTLSRLVSSQMSNHEMMMQNWWHQQEYDLAAWPGSRGQLDWKSNAAMVQMQLIEWRDKHPGLRPEEVAPGDIRFSSDGDLSSPSGANYPPQPPGWLIRLNPEQRQHWEAFSIAVATGATTNKIARLGEAFSQTKPPADALTNVRFLRLPSELAHVALERQVQSWSRFVDYADNALSVSGLPIANLALLQMMRASRGIGLSEKMWGQLHDQVLNNSSPLTAQLLDEAEFLIKDNPRMTEALQSLRQLHVLQERQRKFAGLVQKAVPLNGNLVANVWIADEERWSFCLLNSTYSVILRSEGDTVTNQLTQVRYYPESVIRESFEAAIRASKVELPNYLGATVVFHGRSLPLKLGQASPGGADVTPLATTEGYLTQPAVMLDQNPPHSPGSPSRKEFESMPSHPAFTLSFYLVNRDLMLAQHRQRALWLSGLLAVSALAAVTGFVTARRAFYRQRQLSELKSNFVSSVSHELRAPLASVRLMTESLERGVVREPERQQEYFHLIGRECRRLTGLIENVLDFARIDQGRKQYHREPTDLVALVQHTVKSLEPYATEQQIQLTLAIHGAPRDEDVDGPAMQQALINLIDNAAKFSPSSTTVRIGLEFLPDSVRLTVADQGPGIPEEDHERIFEQFYRRGSELRRETIGIGIGLSIVKHVLEAHGGTARVESEVGHGSRFVLEWPHISQPAEAKKP